MESTFHQSVDHKMNVLHVKWIFYNRESQGPITRNVVHVAIATCLNLGHCGPHNVPGENLTHLAKEKTLR